MAAVGDGDEDPGLVDGDLEPTLGQQGGGSSVRSSTSTTRPSGPRRRSARVPAPTTTPPSTITTASQMRSTSSRWCDEMTMSIPNSVPMRRIRSSISDRWIDRARPSARRGGLPGSCAIAAASLTRCRCPVDMVPTARNRSSPSPTSQSASLARWTAARRGTRCSSARWRTSLRRRELVGQVVVLRRVADARANLVPGPGGVLAEHDEPAGVARPEAEDEREERRLPRAVRAEEPGDAGLDLDVEAGQRDRRAVALDDAARRDDRLRA